RHAVRMAADPAARSHMGRTGSGHGVRCVLPGHREGRARAGDRVRSGGGRAGDGELSHAPAVLRSLGIRAHAATVGDLRSGTSLAAREGRRCVMNKVTKGLIAVLIALFALSGIALAQRPTNSADPASNSSDRAVLVGSDALV